MIKYQGQINNGVEAFGTEGKTITANEVLDTCDSKVLAHHIHMHNALIPEQVASDVLENFADVAAEIMAMGLAIQFKKGNDVVMRIYPDVHVKGDRINLTRAQELDPTVTEITAQNAGSLIDKAGISVRVKAEVEQKFNDLLIAQGASVQRVGIIEKERVARTDSSSQSGSNGSGTTTNPSSGDDSGNGFG